MNKKDVKVTELRKSGNKTWSHLEAENGDDLGFFSRLFKLPIKKDSRGSHIDINESQRKIALKRGAIEGNQNPPTLN